MWFPGLAVGKWRVELRNPAFVAVGWSNVYGLTIVHPCRVKSFREAESAVMDNLDRMLANKIINNLHLMLLIKLTNKLDNFHNKM